MSTKVALVAAKKEVVQREREGWMELAGGGWRGKGPCGHSVPPMQPSIEPTFSTIYMHPIFRLCFNHCMVIFIRVFVPCLFIQRLQPLSFEMVITG